MKIAEDVYLVGDGAIRLSDRRDCHVYLLDGGDALALIDAGVGLATDRILANVRRDGFAPKKIDYLIITHSHADHAGGAHEVRARTGCKVLAPPVEADFLEKGGRDLDVGLEAAKRSEIYPQDYVYRHCRVDDIIDDGEKLQVGRYTLTTIQVPGHSHGIVCLLLQGKTVRSMFSSDVVFFGGTIGLGNWPGCSLDKYRANIKKLAGLNIGALFPGHFLWTLEQGQEHLDKAIENLRKAWVPPAWQHNHPHV